MVDLIESGWFHEATWENVMFEGSGVPEVGQRLGIQYLRTLQPTVSVRLGGDVTFDFHQEAMGMMAISGVVWDAGLLMVDFIQQCKLAHCSVTKESAPCLGKVIDIGCGTGVAGISALQAGAERLLFTDLDRLSCFDLNIEQLSSPLQARLSFENYKWNDTSIPDSFIYTPSSNEVTERIPMIWDTVLCSDLLYESKSHAPLLSVLQRLHFRRAIFAYKKRHDEAERAFFRALAAWCTVRVVDVSRITLVNIAPTALSGLYIVVAEPSAKPS